MRPTARVPVWFMRQAGRSLPEYRRLRTDGSILDVVRHPELAAEITLQPVRRYGVDAAILYSDIVVPVAAIGFGVEIKPGVGPIVDRPFAGAADLARLRDLEPEEDVPYVQETVRILTRELDVPLIGFAGRPVHRGELPDRGRSLPRPAADQGADVRRPVHVAPSARAPRRHRHRFAAGPDRGGGPGRAALRQLGRGPQP